ncbi:O-glycoside alpha-1,2-mannosyltransferase 4 [Yamadazyma tenuis]|uniref:Mannosyltransferase of the KRE2 family n=1 Tax=Candida tenuis (strain ATCC 10573 / BCRC 21748 / CBS 615 / JCM 9827 / NBRC 10315 / NRRL Y-1498 / VKM Y-70) TaxID=590646 RepID=G3BFI9_CANTC|nr:mannosyltransferase of the KRE2 family [Yamadazyma tenuis ATCC 10573]EGV60702.1 mannosyltransferase of the KRE2 family [Yamadazyma tenuis ATCC 10573]WEJ94033.1 O-glycoside alpha-1,2-mannosyltransferase 4 [Yamadazyma tenuis]
MHRHHVDSASKLKFSERDISSSIDAPFQLGCREIDTSQPRQNAAFIVLARNKELDGVIKSMTSLERHFNQWFKYPWVFLNDQEFDDTFKQTVQQYTQGRVEFGVIPPEDWGFSGVDPDEFNEFINSQGDRRIYYGNKASYHQMCRYFSGKFYQHPLVRKRDWYWRVEPDVEFFCDITYDPFVEMEAHNKKYGFNVMIHELYYTVPSLFRETKAFAVNRKIKPSKLWRMMVKNFRFSGGVDDKDYDMIKDRKQILKKVEDEVAIKKFLEMPNKKDLSGIDDGVLDQFINKARQLPRLHEDRFDYEEYNLCHFWSNFEIARTDLFTSELYQEYLQQLELSGGFYKERWGDAPVHSLALAMMLDTKDVHYFRDIGYQHSTLAHCPGNSKLNQLPYTPDEANANNPFFQSYKPNAPVVNGVGCRCKCPLFHREIEDSGSSCLKQWVRTTRDNYNPYRPLDLDHFRQKIGSRMDRYLKKGGKLGRSKISEGL